MGGQREGKESGREEQLGEGEEGEQSEIQRIRGEGEEEMNESGRVLVR